MQGVLVWAAARSAADFFPRGVLEPEVLEIGTCDAGHERMSVQAGPGSLLEVVKTEFLLKERLHKPARRLPQLASGQWNDGIPPEAMIDILAQSAVALLYLRATYQYDPPRDQACSN